MDSSGGVQVFDQKAVIQRWKNGLLTSQEQFEQAVYQHFAEFVPLVYANNLDNEKEERRARKFLFHPLEEFMCQEDPGIMFQKLGHMDKPSQLCGHNFKNGEPTYSCRDCAYDPTCVLCITCFQKSTHKNHRYRMSTSGGGGYCDCGDTEAWKSDPSCVLHTPRRVEETGNEVNLPGDMQQFVIGMFRCVLKFTAAVLTWDENVTLPLGLQRTDAALANMPYLCMLYNDEVHTYDQVINTLQRAVTCTPRQALDYATIVDREGRSCVKSGTEDECNTVRQTIERSTSRHGSKPLKVEVMLKDVVALQQFALKVLGWLQTVSDKASSIRKLMCQTLMEPSTEGGVTTLSVLEKFIQADTRLWKVARVQSHQLLMSCVLKDPPSKKQFSVIFTKWFQYMVRQFSQDDHDHDVSMPSLSVQIFTVPSLARMLIAEHDLLSVIVKAFLSACDHKKNRLGKLSFDRAERSSVFKRSMYVLHDLKYALVCKPTSPEDWSEALRNNFLRGLTSFLSLLTMIQGMDAVKRQTGQHLEFDPEWEGAFTIQIKLEDLLVLFCEWCAADRYLLVEGYKAVMEVLAGCRETCTYKNATVGNHTGEVIDFDVSTDPVSIHYPLNRFLAALHVHLETHGLTFSSPELQNPTLAEMAASVDVPTTGPLDVRELMEPALRIQVLLAQCQAGMWRRNGYSLQNQVFFYSNLRCRQEMYDRDIIMLQIAASLLPGDDFLLQLLNKYNLLNWVRIEYDIPGGQEDSVRQTVTLAEEFLTLLIIILEERYIPGVGQVEKKDTIKREVIHLLCISQQAHSRLSKSLNEDINHETGLDSVVNEIANFKKPQSGGNGKFELKPEYYKEYSPYFYHYYKAEQSKSEEVQRQRKKQNEEDQSLPPPLPPALSSQFQALVNILQCDVMIHLLSIVLRRTAAPRSRSWSEAQFDRVLFIIGLALHEQIRAYERGDRSFQFLSKAMRKSVQEAGQEGESILSLLQSLVFNPNLSTQESKDLLAWVLRKFAEALKVLDEPVAKEHVDSIAKCTDLRSDAERKKRALAAAKRRAKVMAQMAKMQKDFIAENAELFENTSTESSEMPIEMEVGDLPASSDDTLIALGPHQSSLKVTGPLSVTCILCQEEQRISHSGRAMVLSAFVQQSTVLAQHKRVHLTGKEEHDPLFMPSDLSNGTHTSSCGHVMHHECWQGFFTNIVNRERRRPMRFRHSFSYDIDRMEYLCPLCEGLSNTVIPLVPALHTLVSDRDKKTVELKFDDWLDGIQKTVVNSIKEAEDKESKDDLLLFQPCPISTISRMMAESVAKNFQLLWEYVYDDASGCFSEGMREMIKKFARDVYAFGLGVEPDDENSRVPVMAWNTCAFTVQALEQELERDNLAVFESIPERQNALLGAVVRFAAVTSQVMNPDTIKQHCIRLLSALIPSELEKRNKATTCLLDLELFHYLVVLTMTLPALHAEQQRSHISSLPTGGLNDQHALQLVFTAHVVHILLCYEAPCEEEEEMESNSEAADLLEVFRNLRSEARVVDTALPGSLSLLQDVKNACLPFLRCCAILYHHLTGVAPPPQLTSNNSLEFSYLCRYLALPTHLPDLFLKQGENTSNLIQSWCSSRSVRERLSASSEPLVHYPLKLNQLIELPNDYSLLINEASTFTCPKSDGDDSRAPTRCLVCGRMLCSQSYCCQSELEGSQVGAATEHAYHCGANSGIFLRVRECQVLLLSNKIRGCFLPAPYLDIYGETDQGLRRGNPLSLSLENYQSIQKIWYQHNIPQTISRSLNGEPNTSLLIEWHNL
ncbi:E3 ubiquitin-protein ligase UBR2 isoform X1 [Aplysia californica]|uniref:E3 ubiquitin-protein ligase n=1 Tax=Aplysia californica TaxID=6500 RepID=A0ABM0K2F6_APLCA|nr:E3 ubiquitin-protein ligase UBR2 isoform X1 [Aplysia californica]XP_005107158.1 E3 ubiquitin-protein ligase UBR2 isoform X1 [Aplysia californica]